MIGVAIVARAGRLKERQLTAEQSRAAIAEFDFHTGLLVALFSGLMSSCFAFGLDAGAPIRAASAAAGTGRLSQGLPVLCVVLAGGFTTNFLWCLVLMVKSGSARELIGRRAGLPEPAGAPAPLLRNYLLSATGGIAWYLQFFFYTMGESQMGAYAFSSWTLHMASIILFSTLWGFALKEWTGTSGSIRGLVWTGITTLVSSTIVIGLGNYLTR